LHYNYSLCNSIDVAQSNARANRISKRENSTDEENGDNQVDFIAEVDAECIEVVLIIPAIIVGKLGGSSALICSLSIRAFVAFCKSGGFATSVEECSNDFRDDSTDE